MCQKTTWIVSDSRPGMGLSWILIIHKINSNKTWMSENCTNYRMWLKIQPNINFVWSFDQSWIMDEIWTHIDSEKFLPFDKTSILNKDGFVGEFRSIIECVYISLKHRFFVKFLPSTNFEWNFDNASIFSVFLNNHQLWPRMDFQISIKHQFWITEYYQAWIFEWNLDQKSIWYRASIFYIILTNRRLRPSINIERNFYELSNASKF